MSLKFLSLFISNNQLDYPKTNLTPKLIAFNIKTWTTTSNKLNYIPPSINSVHMKSVLKMNN